VGVGSEIASQPLELGTVRGAAVEVVAVAGVERDDVPRADVERVEPAGWAGRGTEPREVRGRIRLPVTVSGCRAGDAREAPEVSVVVRVVGRSRVRVLEVAQREEAIRGQRGHELTDQIVLASAARI